MWSVYDALDARICVLDTRGSVVFVNRAWCISNADFDGLTSRDAWLGRTLMEIAFTRAIRESMGEDADAFDAVVRGARDHATSIVRLLDRHSRTRTFRLAIRSVEKDGAAYSALTVGDLTEAEEAAEELRSQAELIRANERQVRAVINAAPDPILLLDAQRTACDANSAALEMFGARVVGERVDALSFVQLDRSGAQEARVRLRDRVVLLEAHCRPVSLATGVSWVLVVRDITEARALEERVNASERIELVGRLAAGIAHDFNNVLTAVAANAEMLHDESDDDNARALSAEILDAADRAGAMTRQLLFVGRKESSPDEFLDVADELDSLAPMLRRLVGATLRFEIDADPGLTVELSRPAFQQVVLNLVVNAADATPLHGAVRVRATAAPSKTQVWLDVEDDGEGIPPEHLEALFQPFYTTRSSEGGTGLGLATVQRIVMQAEGRIEVESAVGRGSRFRVVLPRTLCQRSAEPPLAPIEGLNDRLPCRVLLVEDDALVRRTVERILASTVEDVISFDDPREALAFADEGAFDLVLSDVVMPHLTGPELVAQIRERRPTVPVVFMSGHADHELIERGMSLSGAAYLPKPFRRETLVQQVTLALQGAAPN